MDEETECIMNDYIIGAENKRNQALFHGQLAAFIYYQGMADGIAQLAEDLKYNDTKNHKEFA